MELFEEGRTIPGIKLGDTLALLLDHTPKTARLTQIVVMGHFRQLPRTPRPGNCAVCQEEYEAYWIYQPLRHKCVCKACTRKMRTPAGTKPQRGPSSLVCPMCQGATPAIKPKDHVGLVFATFPDGDLLSQYWSEYSRRQKDGRSSSSSSSSSSTDMPAHETVF